MKLIDAQTKLKELNQEFIQSHDAAAALRLPRSHASKILNRLAQSGGIVQLARGKWTLSKDVDPFTVPEFIIAPSLCYISLQSALFFHGMISQVPETIYAVSTARTRKYETPIGVYSMHHLEPEFFFGFDTVLSRTVKMAVPEKALLDIFYLSPARSGLFHSLPELEIPKSFNKKLAFQMTEKIRSKSRRTIVRNLLSHLFS